MQTRAKEPDRTRLTAVFQKNIPIFLAFLGLAILMTWPVLAKWNSEWAGGRSDLLGHQWTFWWIKEALRTGRNPFYTTLLYYPNGVSLLTHNIAWLNIAFWLPLQALISEIAAYNVMFILIYALNGFAMYLFAAELIKQRSAAFIAGIIYAFWPYTLSHYDHPNLILTFAVPLALLYLYRTARQPNLRHALLTALFLALIGLSRLQHLALAGLIIVLFVAWLLAAIPGARSRQTIKMLALAGGLSLLFMLPVTVPLVYNQLTRSNPEDVTIVEPDYGRTDLAAYLVPSPDNTFWGDRIKPIYAPYAASWHYTPFTGYMTLLLALLGLIFRWRQTWFWLMLAIIYILLALGPELAVNGQIYPDVPLPYNLIQGTLLGDFIRRPHRLNVFLALPVAMMAGWGATLFSRQQRLKPAVITAVIAAIILIEYSALPFAATPAETIVWNEKLAAEPGDFAVLDIPAHNRSFDKWYMVYQIQHGKPIVGGHASRMPREAFAFIKTVPMLDRILQNDARADFSIANVAEQMRLLSQANVRYLVLHKRFANEGLQTMRRDWLTYSPTYEDEDVIVYHTAPQAGQDFVIEQPLTPEIGLIRADFAPSDAVQGGTIKVDARWGSTAVPGTAYNVCFWLVNGDWRLGIGDCQPVSESWPTDKWQANAALRGSYTLWLEETIPPGLYQLQMALAEGEKVVGDTAVLGPVTIHPFSPANETNANWQDKISLRGYDLAQTEDSLQLLLLTTLLVIPVNAQETSVSHTVAPGDTWTALAYRYNLPEETLHAANPQMNRQRQPVIGAMIALPEGAVSQNGRLLRSNDGDLLGAAVALNTSPWTLALQNGMVSPYRPPLYRPLYRPGGAEPPQDLPPGMTRLELSQAPAQPGQALGVRGELWGDGVVTAVLDGNEMDVFQNDERFLALTGTGAFYGSGQPELTIRIGDGPLWSQPWQFIDPDTWTYQQITLTGEAAQIDQESITQERERLNAIWQQNSPTPQWQTAYQLPITDYLEITSPFGARRSYNGGPYRSYHEGVDFSAYGGTPVMAPAAGTVVLAEKLYVRGYAVIIDHGLGIYSGFYHMSGIDTAVGEQVQPGQIVGAVGTTGLSTGNHLHWDLLVNGVWVDGQAWLEQGMACWILAGWGEGCEMGN